MKIPDLLVEVTVLVTLLSTSSATAESPDVVEDDLLNP
jgi:hypothetical protein